MFKMELKYDFSGWATRNDLVCADGRTIRRDAFKHCDGMSVPIVWNHQHNDPANILGHAILPSSWCSMATCRRCRSMPTA